MFNFRPLGRFNQTRFIAFLRAVFRCPGFCLLSSFNCVACAGGEKDEYSAAEWCPEALVAEVAVVVASENLVPEGAVEVVAEALVREFANVVAAEDFVREVVDVVITVNLVREVVNQVVAEALV